MARMQRATIEEAAKLLGVSRGVIELKIKAGSLVACQEPAFRSYVWIREPAKPAPRRRVRKDKEPADAPAVTAEPVSETGLLRETVAMLKRELEVRDEQLDRLSMELDTRNRELHQLCRLLDCTRPPASSSKTGATVSATPPATSAPAPAISAQETAESLARPPELVVPAAASIQFLSKAVRNLRQSLKFVMLQFRPPLIH